MQIPVNVPGFENREPVLEISGFWSRPKLIIDGLPAPKGPKRGQFILRRNDGVEVVARFVNANFLDPIPHVVVDERPFVIADPMKWYQWLWVGLPVLLVFIGGALGGLIGGAAAGLNGRVFRSTRQGIVKYVSTGIISVIAVAAFLVAATLFNQAVRSVVVNQPKEFTSTAGGFSIMMPFTLKESAQSIDTAIGQIDFHTFLAESGNVAYIVGYSDYPAEIIQQSDPEQMLNGGRDGAAANMKGQVISEDKLTLDTHPGREFVINATVNNLEVTVQARMYLVENRLYQIMLVAPKSEFNRAEADGFLKSFKLLQPTGTPTGIIKPTGKPSAMRGPYDQQADAHKDIAVALAKAKADNKQILLDFGANWCPDCVVLSKLFDDATIKPFLEDNFHVVKIDVGYGDKNLDVSKQYGNPIEKGIPAVVVLDAKGEVVATTKEGGLANARTATKEDILTHLHQWASGKP